MTADLPGPPAVAEMNLVALVHHIQAIRARLAAGCQFMAVVKAEAYGHGAGLWRRWPCNEVFCAISQHVPRRDVEAATQVCH